ncbi:kinase-like protein [Penicillium hispanicum]|uniref:kinase-like protein n=1 Tax=Penicillium hispanicum TaxID=1080232 RepID=UPI0025400264|nr:kinase-like protein [Penicillium hispanicum]KAJ5579546.1 kinase-like protein [Penicillium hispanicum]
MHLFHYLLVSIIQVSLICSTFATPLLLPSSIDLTPEIKALGGGYETVRPLESRDVKHSWWPFKKYDIPKGKQKSPGVYRVGANWLGLGGYKLQLDGSLGSGSFGQVFQATLYKNRQETRVAAKSSTGYDTISGAILMQEVQDLSPYILPTISYFFVPGDPTTYWLVMPKRELGNLFQIKRSQRLEMPHKVQLFRKLLDGLATMHHNGIAHRDLKLPNILMQDMDTPQWADFDSATKNETISSWFGTREYVSPEIVTHIEDHSPKSDDIFAVMMTFFWLITYDNGPRKVWDAVKGGQMEKSNLPGEIREHVRGLSDEMVDLATDCLCKESEGRLDIDALIKRFEDTPEYQDSLGMDC